jgi:hypothetical protein
MRRMFGVLAAVATTASVLSLPVMMVPAAQAATPVTYANTIRLSNCSAALVRYPTSIGTDRALMLTNGHCLNTNPPAGVAFADQAMTLSGSLLNSAGTALGTVTSDRLVYATMTGTDIALYRLTESFDALHTRLGGTPYTISSAGPSVGEGVGMPSSFLKRIYDCTVDGFTDVREDQWTWTDSIRYNVGCETAHGSSGTPIVSNTTNEIVGINNTTNDNGQMCTSNNPCEVAPDGTTTAHQHQSYGQQTSGITTCVNSSRAFDLSVTGCELLRPNFVGNFENGLPGWTAGKGTATTSTAQAFGGVASYLQDQDADVVHTEFPTLQHKAVTLWFYDNPANKSLKSMARVDDEAWDGGTRWRGLGVDTSKSVTNYVYRVGATKFDTGIPRTAGWHGLTWDYTSGTGVKMYVDQYQLPTQTGVTGFNQISMGDWWTDSTSGPVYWDDVQSS